MGLGGRMRKKLREILIKREEEEQKKLEKVGDEGGRKEGRNKA